MSIGGNATAAHSGSKTMTDEQAYSRAQKCAFLIMGKTEGGRKKDRRHKANDDPHAFHELTELFYSFHKNAKSPALKSGGASYSKQ
jgi:hypothetical protein